MPLGRQFRARPAAAYLGVCYNTIMRAYEKGALKGTRDFLHIGRPILFTKEDLDRFRENSQVPNRD